MWQINEKLSAKESRLVNKVEINISVPLIKMTFFFLFTMHKYMTLELSNIAVLVQKILLQSIENLI